MDPQALREDVPPLDDAVYLNTGASGPSPRRVVVAATTALERSEYDAPAAAGAYPGLFDLLDEGGNVGVPGSRARHNADPGWYSPKTSRRTSQHSPVVA
jgi:hypothetical protein